MCNPWLSHNLAWLQRATKNEWEYREMGDTESAAVRQRLNVAPTPEQALGAFVMWLSACTYTA